MNPLFIKRQLYATTCVLLFIATTSLAQQKNFSKKVSIYTKSPSLSCPHLGMKLKENIAKRPTKISDIVFDNNTHQKITFSVRDSIFFNPDSIIALFKASGFPGIELNLLEMEGKEPINLK